MKKIFFALAGAIALLAAIVIVRTATLKSRQIEVAAAPPIGLDQAALVARLAEAIKINTVSFRSPTDSSAGEFHRLHDLLATSFPRLHRQLEREVVNQHSLLFTWKGTEPERKPILLMAHMDVVPVDDATAGSWTHPPFSGQVVDGHIWGRGAMDDKASMMGILEAVEHLLSANFKPRRTIYLAFGHDEEIDGNDGAAKIAALLAERKVELEYVLDEGMNIMRGVIAGVAAPVALIGVAEKGFLSVKLTVKGAGGHSSIPPSATAIGVLSRALERLDRAPFAARLQGATRQMLEFLAPEMAWSQKLPLANLWLFEPLVVRQLSASPLTNAILRTTLAPTMVHGGVKENVLPSHAGALVNLRIMPGETGAGALEQLRRAVDDPRVEFAALPIRVEPSALSDIESPGFKLLQRTIREVAPEAVVAPALLVGGTDSRHYSGLTKNIFRFLPITLGAADTKRYHGVDERISIDDYLRCVRFYAQLIGNSQ